MGQVRETFVPIAVRRDIYTQVSVYGSSDKLAVQ